MVSYNSIVQWMDVNEKKVYCDTVARLTGKYMLYGATLSDGTISIPLEHEKNQVLITDWLGWSAINTITRLGGQTDWVELITAHGKAILGTSDTLIPVYNPDVLTVGFHGERKYAYELKEFGEISDEESIVRVRHSIDDNDIDIHFDTIVSVVVYDNYYHAFDDMELSTIGYHIITKSGFFNCNDIYLSSAKSNKV